MISRLLDVEGPVIGFLDKTGQLIVLSVLWLLGCLPLVTMGTATAALYYAVVKSLRRGQGSAVKEFFRSFRANLGRGTAVTVTVMALGGLLLLDLGQKSRLLSGAALVGLALLAFACLYLPPVLSRFRLKLTEVWKLAFVMSLRFLPYTLLLLGSAAVLAAVQVFLLPMPTVLILPGLCSWGASFPMEKALRHYMPQKQENDNAWYYET